MFTLEIFIGDLPKIAGERPLVSELLNQLGQSDVFPVGDLRLVRDGVETDLLTVGVQLMHHGVVGVLVRDEEGGRRGAGVGVLAAVQDLLVVGHIGGVHGVVESQHHKLEC